MLGGGKFTTMDKILPGSYINFISANRATSILSDRGVVALPIELDWGADGEVFTVNVAEFKENSLKIFGYDYSNEKMKGLRDLFKNIKTGHFFKLNTGGVKATNTYATALYTGARGNDLKIVIEANENSEVGSEIYDVSTFLGTVKVDMQTVTTAAGLKDNDFVTFKTGATLALTSGTPLATGTNGAVADANYQTFLDKIESFNFNGLGCLSTNSTIKALFAAFTKRMRDEVGVKFQCVMHKYETADHEGIISVENNTASDLVYWVLGAVSGCPVNKSCTNKVYDGEYTVDVDYTQTLLETALKAGKFMFHRVNDQIRVLQDINTFVSFTDEKTADFADNQTVRVIDQIGNDIAALFNDKYLGQVPNDASGRISLWNDVVKHHQELQRIKAIENFNPAAVTVDAGETKKSVVITDVVTIAITMTQLYMTVVVQ